ncbi:hypothetical protein G6F68_011979 [Rhizopus microsporus]|nr:hypothetical protein G6F68_011979 [Rhizopus microsporus]
MQIQDGFRGNGQDRERDGARANFIRVLHSDGSMALYGHLQAGGMRVRRGQAVQAGQPIGLSGNSGYSSAPHLHFVVQVNRGMGLRSVPVRIFAAQDHADRKAVAVRRRDPDRRQRQGAQSVPPRLVRLDGNRKATRHFRGVLGDADGIPRLRHQPARHPGPPGLLRRHLPGADGGGCRADGDRRRQRRRTADDPPAAGLPRAQHAHHHVHQQDGPRGARAAGTAV